MRIIDSFPSAAWVWVPRLNAPSPMLEVDLLIVFPMQFLPFMNVKALSIFQQVTAVKLALFYVHGRVQMQNSKR